MGAQVESEVTLICDNCNKEFSDEEIFCSECMEDARREASGFTRAEEIIDRLERYFDDPCAFNKMMLQKAARELRCFINNEPETAQKLDLGKPTQTDKK